MKRLADAKAHRGVEIAVSGSPAWQGLVKELAAEFSKTKTAVEIRYHAEGQNAAIGEFVGDGSPSAPGKEPASNLKSQIQDLDPLPHSPHPQTGNLKSESRNPKCPHPLPLSRVRARGASRGPLSQRKRRTKLKAAMNCRTPN